MFSMQDGTGVAIDGPTGRMNLTRHEREKMTTDVKHGRNHRTIVLLCVLGVLLAAWCAGMVLTHVKQNVAAAVHNMDPSLELRKSEDLADRVGSGKGYPWYTVYKDNQFKGDVYLFTFDNAAAGRFYLAPLFVPRHITWAVYFDDAQTVQRVWSLSPRFPTGLDAGYAKLLSSLEGVVCRDLVSMRKPILPTEGGELDVPVRLAIGNLATAVYASRNSTAELNQIIMEDRMAGLVTHEAFPVFSATTTAGRHIDTALLKGHNTVFITAQPSCGSCFDAVVQTVKKTEALSGDPWNIVLVLFTDASSERSQALIAAVGPSVQCVLDPDRKLGNQVFMPDSPYMTVLDKTATVLYKGSGYSLDDLYAAIDIVQSGKALPK